MDANKITTNLRTFSSSTLICLLISSIFFSTEPAILLLNQDRTNPNQPTSITNVALQSLELGLDLLFAVQIEQGLVIWSDRGGMKLHLSQL